jgi:hypothetical protein
MHSPGLPLSPRLLGQYQFYFYLLQKIMVSYDTLTYGWCGELYDMLFLQEMPESQVSLLAQIPLGQHLCEALSGPVDARTLA